MSLDNIYWLLAYSKTLQVEQLVQARRHMLWDKKISQQTKENSCEFLQTWSYERDDVVDEVHVCSKPGRATSTANRVAEKHKHRRS